MVKSYSTPPPPPYPLGTLLTPDCSLWAFAVSRLKDSVHKDFAAGCIDLRQEGRGPTGIFGLWIVLRVRAGWRPRGTETPAWLCAQDSFHSLQGPGFRDQVVSLQALPLEEADPALALLCLVRALQLCIERSPWFTQAQGVPCPLRLHAHSTRGVTSSWALAHGASLTDICRATGLGDT